MHRWSVLAGVVITGAVLAALLHWAGATPVVLRWLNPSESRAATRILVETTNLEYEALCGPGQTCATPVELPTGDHEVRIRQGDENEWSPYSNVEPFLIEPLEGCAWDFDGSGTVTVADFGAFLAGYQTGDYNAVDFGAFLRVFGKPCA